MIFAFGGTEIVSVAAAETENPEHSVGRAIRTVVWRILVFYIGSVFVIAAVLPSTSAALKSPFAGVLDAARIPGAGTAITLVAVVALLSALNANLYGASRMVYSLSERGEAPRFLSRLSRARVPRGGRRRLRGLRLPGRRAGTALPGPDPAGPVPAGRLHVPGGVGHRPWSPS